MMDFEKFNKMIDVDAYNRKLEEIENGNDGVDNYEELPDGTYEMRLERLQMVENRKGEPMVKLAMSVIRGARAKSWIWVNYNILHPYAMHNLNEVLRDMDLETSIEWDGNFQHYNDVICDVLEEIKSLKIGFAVEVSHDSKGFASIKITDSWEE